MLSKSTHTAQQKLVSENDDLRTQLAEAKETLRAIRSGDWDALIVSSMDGEQIIALKYSELRYRRLFEATPDGILILNANTGAITDINPFLINMLGYSREAFIGRKLSEVSAFKDIEASQDVFEALQTNRYIRYEDLSLKTKDGQRIQVELVSNIYNVEHEKVIQCNFRDITNRRKVQDALETRLREESIRDHLTGLFNRRYMEETLERELHRASRKGLPLGIIMFDIDNFKKFNDTYGHAAGDAILRQLGSFLLEHVRGEDIACRYGGDEFILIMPDAPLTVTQKRADFIYNYVRQFHMQFEEHSLEPITLSMGIGVSPDDDSTVQKILKAVDDAMYKVKRAKL